MAENKNTTTDFEIDDEAENWRGWGENKFSHKDLVMGAMRMCLEKGSVEMIEGFWNNKIDKNGNAVKVYEKDTRKEFIESIKSFMMLTHRDFKGSSDYSKKIDTLKEKIAKRKQYWMDEEWRWWCSLNNLQRQDMAKRGMHANKGMFNRNLDFDNFFHDEELDIYREIFSTICDFIKDAMNDYEGEVYTA